MSEIVSSEDIMALLAKGMSQQLHWFPGDVNASRLAAVLVGMANTAGGIVVIGVAPRSAQVQGLADPGAVMDMVFQAALLADPILVLPLPEIVTIGRARVLKIVVPPGLPHLYCLEGRYLGREGTQTNPLPARRLRQLLLERGIVQFESSIPPNAVLDDLNLERIDAYIESLHLPRPPAQMPEDAWEVLLQRGCLKRLDGVLRPTYAGLLLFGNFPQQWVPSAIILAARFTGTTFADQFVKQEIDGSLQDQLVRVEAFVRDHLHTVARIVGLTRLETPEYPLEAVRELLVNAVTHRDYNQQGDTIHLNLFSDRIEVHSPGGLPGPVNLNNLLQARFSRNAVIAQVLSDLGFVERLGYGLDRVVAVMREQGLRPPKFEEIAGSFRVTLFGELPEGIQTPESPVLSAAELNSRQKMAINYIVRHRRITNHDFQDLCPDVHAETLRRDLADLVARGIILKIGDKRATYYILKGPVSG